MTDPIAPDYYRQGDVECIAALDSCLQNLRGTDAYCTGNAIKYLWRWMDKNGIQDLKKARWYLDRLIATHERVASQPKPAPATPPATPFDREER